MSDLIERLRGRANMARDTHLVDAELDDKAADRIEQLEAALKEIVRNDGDEWSVDLARQALENKGE
jgi:hypothetical protein